MAVPKLGAVKQFILLNNWLPCFHVLLEWETTLYMRDFPITRLCIEGAVNSLKSLETPHNLQNYYRLLIGLRLVIIK